uniref:ATP-dependent DNA ligase family profile domain-containing protein n=1 Tax=Glossina palpalis gambiensis TaxID=67801 RepID=A0A1B0BTR3_9MUSC
MIFPFQVLTARKRKYVDIDEFKVQVCVCAFDLLYLNRAPLVSKQFAERRKLLKEHFEEIWMFATAVDTIDVNEVQLSLEYSIKGNCEGLMVKTLEVDATYEITRRSRNWLKLKGNYLSGCGDSLHLVVIGGYREIADPERGISLGFPHFVRIRDDKSAEMATTAQQLAHKSIGLWDDSWIAPS